MALVSLVIHHDPGSAGAHDRNMNNVQFIKDREIYDRVILSEVPRAEKFLWLGTSALKDLYVRKGSRMVPFCAPSKSPAPPSVNVRTTRAPVTAAPVNSKKPSGPTL